MGQSSSSSICMLDRLADVELQLIMHQLEAKELLQFARSNRRLHHAADSPFAWRYSILRLSTKHNLLLPQRVGLIYNPPPPRSRLLRHASIGLIWTLWFNDSTTVVDSKALVASSIAALGLTGGVSSQLVEVDASACPSGLHASTWNHLLIQPEMQHLTSLTMHDPSESGDATNESMRALTKLPKLRTLYAAARRPKDGRLERTFAQMPSLTELHLEDNVADQDGDSCLPLVSQCKHLTLLDVRCPAIRGNMFRQLFAESNLRTLKSLQLTNFNSSSVLPDDFIATFTAMTHLQALHLHSLSAVPIMSYLHHAPVLQCFTLQLAPLFMSTQATWMPSTMDAFAGLLITCRSSLQCTLIFKSDVRREYPQPNAAIEQRKLLLAASNEMRRLKKKVQARFQVTCPY